MEAARAASRAGTLGRGSIWPWLLRLNTAAKSVTPLKADVMESNGTLRLFHLAAPSGWSASKKREDLGADPHCLTSGQEVLWFERQRSLSALKGLRNKSSELKTAGWQA